MARDCNLHCSEVFKVGELEVLTPMGCQTSLGWSSDRPRISSPGRSVYERANKSAG